MFPETLTVRDLVDMLGTLDQNMPIDFSVTTYGCQDVTLETQWTIPKISMSAIVKITEVDCYDTVGLVTYTRKLTKRVKLELRGT